MLNGQKVSSISSSQTGDIELFAQYEVETKPQDDPQPSKKGCKKSSGELIVSLLSATSLAVILIRKK